MRLISPVAGFRVPFLPRYFITTRIYGESALVFWLDYSEDNGERSKGECDGVQALSELLLKRSKEDKVGGRNCSIIILGCALYCFENGKKGSG